MIEFLLNLDRELFLKLNGAHAPWLDPVMVFLSNKYVWIPFYILLVYIIFRNYKRQTILIVIMIALTITLADQITTSAMKPYFQRFRPSNDPELADKVHIVDGYRGSKFGFASSHAANTFGLATFLFLLFRKKDKRFAWLFLWAALVTYSRVYLGVHYPGDIIVGGIIGALCATLCYFLLKWIKSATEEKISWP